MRPQLALPFHGELIIDNFAGGGGTSTGLEAAFGRPVDIAINHDPEALAMHALNRPGRGACTRQLRPRSGLYAAPGLIGNSHAASPCQTAIIEAGAFAYTRT